ncbi:MAG: ArsC/Spx/MgsR family protein [Paracoccaceae bacterium]
MRLFGLKTCDTCRKALKEIAAAGGRAEFHDIRAELDAARLDGWLSRVGVEALVNRRSTTWRGLSEAERAAADGAGAAALLLANPALIKRPVIEAEAGLFVGWDDAARAALL